MIRELLGHPPAPDGHAAWVARIRELTEVVDDLPDSKAEHAPGQAKTYYVLEGDPFRQHPNGVGLQCITSREGVELLKDIHLGDCGHHLSPRALASKVLRHGLYWPTALEDAAKLIETCGDHRPFCDFHQVHSHATKDCIQLKKLRDERLTKNGQAGPSRSNGRRGSGRGNDGWSRGRRDEPHLYSYGGGYGGYYQL